MLRKNFLGVTKIFWSFQTSVCLSVGLALSTTTTQKIPQRYKRKINKGIYWPFSSWENVRTSISISSRHFMIKIIIKSTGDSAEVMNFFIWRFFKTQKFCFDFFLFFLILFWRGWRKKKKKLDIIRDKWRWQ